jgi:uncharacterized protein (DUF1330 family)
MSAYAIFYVKEVHDLSALEQYKRRVRPTLEEFGGVIRVLRTEFAVLEGEPLQSIAMIEFASIETARAWYRSPGYQEALQFRVAGSTAHAVICAGLD